MCFYEAELVDVLDILQGEPDEAPFFYEGDYYRTRYRENSTCVYYNNGLVLRKTFIGTYVYYVPPQHSFVLSDLLPTHRIGVENGEITINGRSMSFTQGIIPLEWFTLDYAQVEPDPNLEAAWTRFSIRNHFEKIDFKEFDWDRFGYMVREMRPNYSRSDIQG